MWKVTMPADEISKEIIKSVDCPAVDIKRLLFDIFEEKETTDFFYVMAIDFIGYLHEMEYERLYDDRNEQACKTATALMETDGWLNIIMAMPALPAEMSDKAMDVAIGLSRADRTLMQACAALAFRFFRTRYPALDKEMPPFWAELPMA